MGNVAIRRSSSRGNPKYARKQEAELDLVRLWYVTLAMWVPTEDIGADIGKSGRHILSIQNATSTRVNIPVSSSNVSAEATTTPQSCRVCFIVSETYNLDLLLQQ